MLEVLCSVISHQRSNINVRILLIVLHIFLVVLVFIHVFLFLEYARTEYELFLSRIELISFLLLF